MTPADPNWPHMTFDPSNISPSGHGSFLPNLVAIGHSFVIWPLLTPFDPCMTFDPSNALLFSQGFFLPNLLAIGHSWAIWPVVDPGWPLYDIWPQQCITLWVRGSFYQIWWPWGISKATWPLDDLWPLEGSRRKYALKPRGPAPYPNAKFQLHTSKYGEMHCRIYILYNTHTYHTYTHT